MDTVNKITALNRIADGLFAIAKAIEANTNAPLLKENARMDALDLYDQKSLHEFGKARRDRGSSNPA